MRQLKINQAITNRADKSLYSYLQDIAPIELISALEEVELAQKIRAWDQEALEKLVKSNLRFVVSVAKQYQYKWLSLPDLINEGNLGLIKAAQRFDESRGFKFISYAVWWIRQSILMGLAENARIVRLPLNRVGQINKVNKAANILEQNFEREPTADDIAQFLDMDEDKIKDVLTIQTNSVSFDKPHTESIREGTNLSLLDMFESTDFETPDHDIIQEWLALEINRSLATLTPREQWILEYLFWLNGKPVKYIDEVAKMFDITKERTRQIKDKAIHRLKRPAVSKNLKQYR